MGLYHVVAGGPGKDGEAAILGGDERDRIALVLRELSGGEMAGAAQLLGVDQRGGAALDRLGHRNLLHRGPTFSAYDFGAKSEDLQPTRHDHGAIDSGEPGHGIDGTAERFLPGAAFGFDRSRAAEDSQFSERLRGGVGDWSHDRFAPGVADGWDH